MLCSNRFPLPGSPSTCSLDTIIIPIPSFVLFVGIGLLVCLRPTLKHDSDDFSRVRPQRWSLWLHMFFVFAAFGMSVLEIVRLALADRGVGLLPATPAAMLLILFLQWYERNGRTHAISVMLLIYWPFLVVFEIIKVLRVHMLLELSPAKDTPFPASDQLTDNIVMTGLFALLMGFEAYSLMRARRLRRQARSEEYRKSLLSA
ncbi:hypothetical protein BDN71DRAFT_1443672 [Pleurotus eryngii]|uniref:ABC transporter TMD0 domain-containing protein n=1 Tax=Pleurotus eryngii TaxID=5323 RepID=A0A9P6DHR8_PLEER|nr:hypothetical protein BDN71DRAFT_1443672 [Pleurotus eryngii]